jgi:hypothetical protein
VGAAKKPATTDEYSNNDEFYDGEDEVKRSNFDIESMTDNGSTP